MKSKILRFLFILSFGFYSCESFAGIYAEGDEGKIKRTTFFFSADSRNSFITSTEAHLIGFRAGAEINNRLRLGIGYHYLSSEIVRTIPIDESIKTNAQIRLRYGSVSAEYVLYDSDLWQITAPLIVGFGESSFIPPASKYGIMRRQFTLLLEPSLTVQYNLIPFIGIGTGIGYRIMPVGDSSLRSTFATPLYDFRIKLLINEVIEAVFPNGLWKKKNAEEKNSAP